MARHKLLTTKEVSEWLQIPESTLKRHRSRPPEREPVPHLTLPNGDVRYREDQVNQWIEDQSEITKLRVKRTG